MPGSNAAREVFRVEAKAAKLGDGIAADLEAVDAVGDDRLVLRKVPGPVGDSLRGAHLGPRQHVAALGQILGEADVEHDEVLSSIEAGSQILRCDGGRTVAGVRS